MKSFKQKNVIVDCFDAGQNTVNKNLSLPIEKPKISFNVKVKDGFLVCANGFERMKNPVSPTLPNELQFGSLGALTIQKIWPYKYFSQQNQQYEYLLVAYMSDGKLYYTVLFAGDTSFHLVSNSPTFTQAPHMIYFSIDGIERMAIASDDNNLVVWYGDSLPQMSQSILPKIYSSVQFNGRIFSLSKAHLNKVLYSTPSSSLSWSQNISGFTSGGSIEIADFKGNLNKLVAMGDYVYVFMDFGIARINQYSFNTFTVSNVYVSSTKIYADSVCVCGDSIFFLAEDGLYYYSNLSVKKFDLGFEDMLSAVRQTNVKVCTHLGKLFLACKLDFDDQLSASETGLQNNVLVEINIATKQANITRGVDVNGLVDVNFFNATKLVATMRGSEYVWQLNSSGTFGTTVLPKHWQSTPQNLGDFDKTKILKKICFSNCSAARITLTTENEQKTFDVPTQSKGEVLCNLPFKFFDVQIDSTSQDFCMGSAQFNFKVEK